MKAWKRNRGNEYGGQKKALVRLQGPLAPCFLPITDATAPLSLSSLGSPAKSHASDDSDSDEPATTTSSLFHRRTGPEVTRSLSEGR